MSDKLVVCSSCGEEIPEGRFCKSCGRPLHENSDLINLDDEENDPPLIVPISDKPLRLPEFGVIIKGMDEKALCSLLARAEISVLDVELDRLIEEIQATRQALRLEHADKGALAARAEHLRETLEKAKKRRSALLEVKWTLRIEQIIEELDSLESKISKLKEMRSSLDKEVYQEQGERLTKKLKVLKKEFGPAKKEARGWLKRMIKAQKELLRESNRLEAKHKIGDLSDRIYRESKSKVDRSLRILEGGLKILGGLIKTAEKM
jgi:predicted  nucleic acid-binding Zn-ribbon protein